MITGAYVLHLYCANGMTSRDRDHAEWPGDCPRDAHLVPLAEVGGLTEADARREARKQGWVFRDGDVWCRDCAKGAT